MWVKQSLQIQQHHDLEWVNELAQFINQNNNKKELEKVKKIFIETYFDYIHEGVHPKIALQKAKSVAFCFSMLQTIK